MTQVYTHQIMKSTARNISGNSQLLGTRASEAVITVDVTAVSGTSPTLDVKVQHACKYGEYISDMQEPENPGAADTRKTVAFQQITAAGTYSIRIRNFNKYIRLSYTIGGTTPSFTFSACVHQKVND